MPDDPDPDPDPRNLIRESYAMAGISAPECRSVFLDWALGLPTGVDEAALVAALLERHAVQPADHPMTAVLRAALAPQPTARRRGGRAARLGDDG
jgi:hypothetical protein